MYVSAGHLAVPAATYTTYAAAPAYHAPLDLNSHAYGTSSQNVIRSYGGTISQYAKAVDTPFSSVRKQDTRITNNLYSPGYYATAPVHHHQVLAPAHHQVIAPAHHHVIAAPAATYATHTAAYAHPAAYTHHTAAYAHPTAYAHPAAYAPAAAVSHVSFDGLGAHYAW